MGNRTINIKKPKGLPLSSDGFKKIRRGEILHLTLSYIKTIDDLDNLPIFLKRALSFFQEKEHHWDIKKDFLKPLLEFFESPISKKIFSNKAKNIYIEKDILKPNSVKVIRPDRCVVFEQYAIVVDFKTEEPVTSEIEDKYRKQIREYCDTVAKILNIPCYGYLVYLLKPSIRQVV